MLLCITSMAFGLLMMVFPAAVASAQQLSPLAIVRAHSETGVVPAWPAAPAMRIQRCAVWNIVGFTLAGAAFGYFVGSFQPFASDTGRLYQVYRRKVALIAQPSAPLSVLCEPCVADAFPMGPPNEELNQRGGLRRRLARRAREPHHMKRARWLTPAR